MTDWLTQIREQETLVLDTEWYSPNDFAILGIANVAATWAVALNVNDDSHLKIIKEILASEQTKIWQNYNFDVVALGRQGYVVNGKIEDTMVAFHTLYPDLKQKGLDTLGSIYSLIPYWKDERDWVGKDDKKGREYCAKDCLVTADAWRGINDDFKRVGDAGYQISMSIADTMARTSVRGIRVSRSKLVETRNKYEEEAKGLEKGLKAFLGISLNVNSPKKVLELCRDVLKIRDLKSTKQEKLMEVAASTHDPKIKVLMTAIVRIRQKKKIVSSFLQDSIFSDDGRARTEWRLYGTKNGRLSTKKPWWPGLALQTTPEDARGIYVPDPGHVFVGWDLAQAEARYVAILTQDFELLEAMNNGIDIHCLLGSQMPAFNLTYDELMAMKAELGGNFPERFLMKKGKHSLNYMGSWVTLKSSINKDYLDTGVGINAADAKILHADILSRSPNLPTWWDEVKRVIRSGGVITNALGRKRDFSIAGQFSDTLWRDAVACEPQGGIADLTTLSIARLDKIWGMGARGQVMAHMHDGAFGQVREEYLDQALDDIREATNQTLTIRGHEIKIPVDIKWSAESWEALG